MPDYLYNSSALSALSPQDVMSLGPIKVSVDTDIPEGLVEIFSSGTRAFGDTVVNPFQIQPRTLQLPAGSRPSSSYSSSDPFPVLENYQTIMLNGKVEAVEVSSWTLVKGMPPSAFGIIPCLRIP